MIGKLYTLAGAAIAVAGADKLFGQRGYANMFRHLGWTRNEMQLAALVETAGGVLMASRPTRRLGGALVAGVSTLVILSEVEHGDARLAAPRGLVLFAGLAAAIDAFR